MTGPTPRKAEEDPYKPMSKAELWRRLTNFEAPPGISKSRFLIFCKTVMPVSASDMTPTQQENFSRAFWQMDRGYLKITKGKRKNYLYLTIGGKNRQDDVVKPEVKGWAVDFNSASLQWKG